MRVSSVGWVTEARGLVTECEAGGREQGSPGAGAEEPGAREQLAQTLRSETRQVVDNVVIQKVAR